MSTDKQPEWELQTKGKDHRILVKRGPEILDWDAAAQLTREQAALIVRAVNSRAALLAAMQGLVAAMEWVMGKEPSPCRCLPCAQPPHVCFAHKEMERARDALQQAQV
jgi:hypothetical protein